MEIMQQLEAVLHPCYFRGNPEIVDPAFDELTSKPCELLRSFYRRFRGRLGSYVTGLELLDIVEGDPSVVTATEILRSQFGLSEEWLMISDVLANGMLVYNAISNEVFGSDFEGGLEMMVSGELEPEWKSLEDFFTWYFELDAEVS